MAYNFDDFISDTKNIFDKVAARANDAVDYSKTQIDRAQLRSKIREKYAELGKICYEMHESDSDETISMKPVIAEIKELKKQLVEADKNVNAKKNQVCKFCETTNDFLSVYCSKCGEKLS